jgi:hypothetical protein
VPFAERISDSFNNGRAAAHACPANESFQSAKAEEYSYQANAFSAQSDILSARADAVPARADSVPARADVIPARADVTSARADIVPARADIIFSKERKTVPVRRQNKANKITAEAKRVENVKRLNAKRTPSRFTVEPLEHEIFELSPARPVMK